MTQEPNVSVPNAARGLFASGIVLGLSLGLVASHLLLFARKSQDSLVTAATEDFPPFDPSGFAFSAEPDVEVPDDISFSIAEVGETQKVGRAKISDRSDEEELHFFPEALSGESSETLAPPRKFVDDEVSSTERTWLASADEVESDRPVRKTVELPPATETAPQSLQPLPGASPIDERTLQREQLAESIIDEELPDATPQEREIWGEVLQGLPAEDIKGILRMRKHIGPGNPFPSISALSPLMPRRPLEPADVEPSSDPEEEEAESIPLADEDSSVRFQLDRIARHNLANRTTIGFKRLVPVLVEVAWDDTVDRPANQLARVIRDMTPGDPLPTGRMLDVAIDEGGFLQVRQGDMVRYTRDGRLTLDDQGRLKLLAQTDAWLLDPQVIVPAEATEIIIAEDGRVTVTTADMIEPAEVGTITLCHFLNPESLGVDATGLFRPTNETGQPFPLPADASNAGTLFQGFLETSNVQDGDSHAGPIADPSVR